MKRVLIILAISVALIPLACKKEKVDNRVVTVSQPSIALTGDKYVTLNVGQAYEDPGAMLTDDISGTTSAIHAESSTLDINTPGLYYMLYTGSNNNGYITKVARYIAVTDYPDTIDLEGVYERTANGVQVNLTRVSRAMYMTDDMGGAGLPDAAYFAVINDSTIDLGPQLSESIGEEISGSSEGLEIGPSDTLYTYKLSASGYGTAQRVFVKVH